METQEPLHSSIDTTDVTTTQAQRARKVPRRRHKFEQVDPEHDAALDDRFAIGTRALQSTHVDPGPSLERGGRSSPAQLFARWLVRLAGEYPGVALTPEFVGAFSTLVERKFDATLDTAHAATARALNRILWLDLIDDHGLERARELKASTRWHRVRRVDSADGTINTQPEGAPESAEGGAS